MPQYSKVILYHAYGLIEIYQQVLFSLLTLHYHLNGHYEDLGIVVYTDNPKLFQKYAGAMPLTVETLNQETISAYKGRHKFVHRVKICIIKDCFSKYGANVFYLDSDTYFTKSPVQLLQKIDPATSIMNSNDYDLNFAEELYENEDWLIIRRAIRNFTYTVKDKPVKIPYETRMWNAGVIGIHLQHAGLLDEILDLTDQIYGNIPVFTAEQFAFSYFLQNNTNLVSSEDVIFHYWPNFENKYWKQTYNYHFQHFFRQHNSLTVHKQAEFAYALTLKHNELKLPQKTLLNKIKNRLKLIATVTLKGR